ncbi:MAG TPA: TIR domain-containing protein [Anaerohalosphaeraceae bacterium]|nr:TIR domain-containing protein [Anaerohalosphaeraceae bacterium]HOL90019.1 TIR domain-containing protein [Anaerohalosphaeraceae bacterium]HPP57334.1 TIR domain-containing protein [Anaerohalosphaeraceae bacterium]
MGGGGGSISSSDLNRLENIAKEKLSQSSKGNRHVFISFAYEDLDTVNMLRGQAKNDNIPINFDDYSVKEPFDSKDSDYIKTKIRAKIDHCSITIVYLSNNAAKSKWVNWEIEESIKKNKSVIGVYSGDAPPSEFPPAFLANKCKVVKWSDLQKAIEDASQNR